MNKLLIEYRVAYYSYKANACGRNTNDIYRLTKHLLSENVLMECSIPQGSVLGPKNYVMYTKPLGDVIRTHELPHHFYDDDT